MKKIFITILLLWVIVPVAVGDSYYQWVDSADIYIEREEWERAVVALLNA